MELVNLLRECFPQALIQDLAEMARSRFCGSLVLRVHEGKVLKAETRTVRAYDARR